VAALAALTAGCFQPMYAEHADGTPGLRDKLMTVDLPPVDKATASRDARIGVEIRNALAEFLKDMRGIAPQVKWVRAENLHVTLKFLGETDAAKLRVIEGTLNSIRSPRPVSSSSRRTRRQSGPGSARTRSGTPRRSAQYSTGCRKQTTGA